MRSKATAEEAEIQLIDLVVAAGYQGEEDADKIRDYAGRSGRSGILSRIGTVADSDRTGSAGGWRVARRVRRITPALPLDRGIGGRDLGGGTTHDQGVQRGAKVGWPPHGCPRRFDYALKTCGACARPQIKHLRYIVDAAGHVELLQRWSRCRGILVELVEEPGG
jgi:hypothetical protein